MIHSVFGDYMHMCITYVLSEIQRVLLPFQTLQNAYAISLLLKVLLH